MTWTDYSSAPEVGTPICARAAVRGALAVAVETASGAFPLLLVETAAGVRAYVNACPHQYLPLDHRGPQVLSIDGRRLTCSNHEAQFDAESGEGVAGHGLGCHLDAVPVHEADGMLRIGAGPQA
ncbi:Rieske (2Fe-2S) protein [Roseitranquillus sediminis]|uniref:Rieske (2Fe-2S) protein n=1 Tax=Roseitranquillus sediminis TaxID=2809051 RepID=UPI001D0CB557|nr:Rieske 2Fe-2S domain-containing protein [Roseitranquillus sediminis]MBM9596165.1 Rieske 2Fe-2S domain-containing protein [Roseitranquillus sediminis]